MSEETLIQGTQWWTEPEGEKHEAVTRTVRLIRQNQEYRKVQDLIHASLYGNIPITGFGYSAYSRPMPTGRSRLSLNVVRNMIGAVTSKIASKSKPKPSFVTEGGDYELRDRAEKLEKFVAGVFYESGFYANLPRIFRDCCVFGTGFVKVFSRDGEVKIDRVLPWEIVVDDGEAMYGNPPSIYQRKYWDRLQLIATAKNDWGASEETLQRLRVAKRDDEDNEIGYQTTADQLLMTEAWHPRSGKGAEDGRHAGCVEGVDLFDDEWTEPTSPLCSIQWSPPLIGFFGTGLAEELTGIQHEINTLLLEIQRGHHLIKGHYLVENGSKVVSAHLNNDLAAIVRYTGTPPQYQTPSAIASDVYKHLWDLYARAYEITGISQMAAQSQKPPGLDAAVAIESFNDIQTERFLEIGQALEEFVLDVARQVVICARAVAKGGGYKVKARSKNTMETIDWRDVDLDDDKYVLKVYPTSMLPSTPAGKRQWVANQFKLGVIPPEDILEAVDMPDTEAITKRLSARRRLIERRVAMMFKEGRYITPEPFDDHKLAMRIVNEMYAEAQNDARPEAQLELLRKYLKDTRSMMPPPAPPALPPGPSAPPMPAMMPPGPPANDVPPPMPPAVAPAGAAV
jgi:hypothetical protein